MERAPNTVRLVILDDDPATLLLERRVLERAGYVVVATRTPEEASAAVERDAPDLLVLDYRIGGVLNGLDLFRALRASRQTLPAILVTSFSDESKIIEALRAGIRDVVPKSGDYLDYLPQAVARVVDQVQTERQRFESAALRDLVQQLRHSVAAHEAVAKDNARLLESERSAREESQRANRLKDEFLATLSHELRTPLNAILGWSQLLRTRSRTAEEMDHGLQTIERNARVQAQIVNDLLEMSRIISGKLRLDVQRVELALAVDSAIHGVTPAAEAKEIRLHATLDPRADAIAGDPARLQQILWNLLTNAIKFTPPGGRVEVALTRLESHVEIRVSDTGQGIRPDFLPYMFDRFRQGDASTTREHRGMGLGLSIVKSLVEMHGGTVTAQSEGDGQGATFVVTLPALSASRPAAAAASASAAMSASSPSSPSGAAPGLPSGSAAPAWAAPASAAPAPVTPAAAHLPAGRHVPAATGPFDLIAGVPLLAGVRVLVVDDEPDARELLKRILVEYEADVETVSSAQEALPLIQGHRHDVLVCDIGMPTVDGYELIRRVRSESINRGGQIPALAVTAFARSEDRQRALLAGYQGHVAKPVEPSELVTMIASIAGRLSPRA